MICKTAEQYFTIFILPSIFMKPEEEGGIFRNKKWNRTYLSKLHVKFIAAWYN